MFLLPTNQRTNQNLVAASLCWKMNLSTRCLVLLFGMFQVIRRMPCVLGVVNYLYFTHSFCRSEVSTAAKIGQETAV